MVLLESGSDGLRRKGFLNWTRPQSEREIYGTVERRAYGRQRCS